jgi:hypothetical protein
LPTLQKNGLKKTRYENKNAVRVTAFCAAATVPCRGARRAAHTLVLVVENERTHCLDWACGRHGGVAICSSRCCNLQLCRNACDPHPPLFPPYLAHPPCSALLPFPCVVPCHLSVVPPSLSYCAPTTTTTTTNPPLLPYAHRQSHRNHTGGRRVSGCTQLVVHGAFLDGTHTRRRD